MSAARPLLVSATAFLAACSPGGGSNAQTRGAALGAPAPALVEANRVPPTSLATMKMSFAPVVRRAAPAVVNISSRRVVRTQVDPFFEFFGGGFGIPREQVQGSLGSGAIVRADGVIVTNNHVVEGGQEITVSLADRREFPAKVLLADARADIAVLKIDARGERLPVLPLASGPGTPDVQVGDLVLAIGDPFGVGQTVTNGIVSALSRTGLSGDGGGDFSSYIQTDAAINPGNSGGPLVDMNGNLIGLNTFILSRSGSSSGVGFAVPAALVRRVVETAAGGGRSVARPWLGARTQAVTAEAARSLGLDRPEGVLVSQLYPGGPAARAGIDTGDVILSADGQDIFDDGALNYRVATHGPGETMTVRVRRAGAVRQVGVRLESPPEGPRETRVLAGRQPLAGATVASLSPASAAGLGLDPLTAGVIVTAPGESYAGQAGFQAGDIIREVNGRPVKTTASLAAELQAAGSWRIVVERGGRRIVAAF